ncbi:uncharacterized protein LOC135050422 [Pseudophryne corroboree]|uniref:uncharacterized protein LOC135050422 n=1 Tax=Pseudophryne corroboree TaxID=495146 RepID=UPI003081ACDA
MAIGGLMDNLNGVKPSERDSSMVLPTDGHPSMSSAEYRQFWSGLIDLYRQNECLWRVRSPDYANRIKRNRAYQQLIEYSRGKNSDVDVDWVKKKISNFRTVFVKERKKVQDSQRSGAGTDEVYKPTLWYYDQIQFIIEQEARVRSRDALDPESPVLVEEEAQESLDLDATPELEVEPTTGQGAEVEEPVAEPVAPPQARPGRPRRTARRTTSAAYSTPSGSQQFFQRAEEVLHRPPDAEQQFGNFIASEMRLMTDDQKFIVQRLVNEIVSRGRRQTLVSACEIVPTDPWYHPNLSRPPFPNNPPMEHAPVNPPQQPYFFPSGATQPSPSLQSSTSSSGMYSDMQSTQSSVLGDPRFFHL